MMMNDIKRIPGYSKYMADKAGLIVQVDIDQDIVTDNESLELNYKYNADDDKILLMTDPYIWLTNDHGCVEYRSVRRLIIEAYNPTMLYDPTYGFRYTSIMTRNNEDCRQYEIFRKSFVCDGWIYNTIPGFGMYGITTDGVICNIENKEIIHSGGTDGWVRLTSNDREIVWMRVLTLYCMAYMNIPQDISVLQLSACYDESTCEYHWGEHIGN